MKKYPIIANKDFQEAVLAEVNTALGNGVTAAQLADYLEHCIVRQLRAVAAEQMKAALAEQAAEAKEESAND